MPKITRRKSSKPKSSGSTIVLWKKIMIVSLPALLFLFVLNQSQGSVLGVSDFIGKKTSNLSPKPSGACKPTKISSITFSSSCDEKMGFQKVTYTCGDGTSSSISSSSCGNPQQLFEKVMKACNKNTKCKPQVQKQNNNQQNGKGNMQRGGQHQQNQNQQGQDQGQQGEQEQNESDN